METNINNSTGTIMSPAAIEAESMRIIEKELEYRGFIEDRMPDPLELAVVKRVIHATADFDFADNLVFTGEFFRAPLFGTKKTDIITDTNMILSGLNRPAMERLNAGAFCFMNDDEIKRAAEERGITRASAAMEHAAGLYKNGIYVIGNAPTALLKITELTDRGIIAPSLVVGVPVGFVNVKESKELALKCFKDKHIPAVLSMGRKGGSTVAVAVINAVMYHREGRF